MATLYYMCGKELKGFFACNPMALQPIYNSLSETQKIHKIAYC